MSASEWLEWLEKVYRQNKQGNKKLSRSSLLEVLVVSGARPIEIVASTGLISVLNVLVFFHNLLWKAKLDWEWFERDY